MLGIIKTTTVTNNRRERRAQVTQALADDFVADLRNILGDNQQKNPQLRKLKLRDEPPAGYTFVTNTDYLPAMKVYDNQQQRMLKGVIRIRNYIIVPEGTETLDLDTTKPGKIKYVKLADGNEPYAKLEFKVGNPEMAEDGNLRDIKGVVDKPGVVLSVKDIYRLRKSKRSFNKNREAILARAAALTLTTVGIGKDGKPAEIQKKVNENMAEVEELINRIGLIHDAKLDRDALSPEVNMRYQRTAYKTMFKHPEKYRNQFEKEEFEVQVTVDKDIRMKGIAKGDIWRYPVDDRVVELKIPLVYANKSDSELEKLGLKDLAAMRASFLKLQREEVINPGTTPDAGKTPNMKDGRGQYLGRFPTSPLKLDD